MLFHGDNVCDHHRLLVNLCRLLERASIFWKKIVYFLRQPKNRKFQNWIITFFRKAFTTSPSPWPHYRRTLNFDSKQLRNTNSTHVQLKMISRYFTTPDIWTEVFRCSDNKWEGESENMVGVKKSESESWECNFEGKPVELNIWWMPTLNSSMFQ